MKNITLKIDDETYHKARIQAARKGTSVSAVVRDYLAVFAEADEEELHARRVESLQRLYARADARATPREQPLIPLTRDEILKTSTMARTTMGCG